MEKGIEQPDDASASSVSRMGICERPMESQRVTQETKEEDISMLANSGRNDLSEEGSDALELKEIVHQAPAIEQQDTREGGLSETTLENGASKENREDADNKEEALLHGSNGKSPVRPNMRPRENKNNGSRPVSDIESNPLTDEGEGTSGERRDIPFVARALFNNENGSSPTCSIERVPDEENGNNSLKPLLGGEEDGAPPPPRRQPRAPQERRPSVFGFDCCACWWAANDVCNVIGRFCGCDPVFVKIFAISIVGVVAALLLLIGGLWLFNYFFDDKPVDETLRDAGTGSSNATTFFGNNTSSS